MTTSDALRRRVDVEAVLAQEADQRHAEAFGGRDREARRCADGREYRDPGGDGLLHDLIPGTTAHREQTVAERQQSVEKCAAHDLVDGVVPAYVLAQKLERARSVEETCGVKPASALEDALLFAQAVRKGWKNECIQHGSRLEHREIERERFHGRSAADAAGRAGQE